VGRDNDNAENSEIYSRAVFEWNWDTVQGCDRANLDQYWMGDDRRRTAC